MSNTRKLRTMGTTCFICLVAFLYIQTFLLAVPGEEMVPLVATLNMTLPRASRSYYLMSDENELCSFSGNSPNIVLFGSLHNNSAASRNEFWNLWRAVEVTCSYRAVLVTPFANTETLKREVTSWWRQHCSKQMHVRSVYGDGLRFLDTSTIRATSLQPVILSAGTRDGQMLLEEFTACSGITTRNFSKPHRDPHIKFSWTHAPSDWEKIKIESRNQNESRCARALMMEKQEYIINPYEIPIIIDQPDICTMRQDVTELIIFVHATPSNVQLREKIRNSWAANSVLSRLKAIRLFVMGTSSAADQQSLVKEGKDRRDIIQGNFIDSYRNLTMKQRFGLRFLSERCKDHDYKYILKLDEDVVPDLEALSRYLRFSVPYIAELPTEKIFFCSMFFDVSPVIRNPHDKWYVTALEYPGESYPYYCHGIAYVLTKDLVLPIYEASLHTRHFWIDDVYITGFVARNVPNITYVSLPNQKPFVSPGEDPIDALNNKKWFFHSQHIVSWFDKYFLAFSSRHNVETRQKFIESAKNSSKTKISMETFEYL